MQQYTDASFTERIKEKQHHTSKRQRDETQPKKRGGIRGMYPESSNWRKECGLG